MSAVTLSDARTRLTADLKSIAGIKRIYGMLAEQMPDDPDCPCFELDVRDPMLSVRGRTSDLTEDTLMLNLAFLYKPQALGNPIENMEAIERFIRLTKQKLYANFTGGGLYLINKDTGTMNFSGYLIRKTNAPAGSLYWGFTLTLDLTILDDTPMSAGT